MRGILDMEEIRIFVCACVAGLIILYRIFVFSWEGEGGYVISRGQRGGGEKEGGG